MDAGVVQHQAALRHPEEARALLIGLGPQLRHLQQLLPGGEGAVFLPPGHDVLRRGRRKAADPAQEGGRRGVQIRAHGVHAVLHHRVQALLQPLLGHIMLVLPHADGLGLDLHQLRQGILEAAGDGHGGAEVHVILGKFLRRQLAGAVYAGPGLAHHHVAHPGAAAEEIHRHLLRFPGGGAVADGDMLHPVPGDQGGQGIDAGGPLLFPVGGVDHGGIQHLAGGIHHRHLAAHAVARVQAHGHLPLHRGRHEQGFQIQCEVMDRPLRGGLRQGRPGLRLHAGLQQAVVSVRDGGPEEGLVPGAGLHHAPGDLLQGQIPVQGQRYLQEALLLPPVHGQDLMPLQPGNGLGKIVVQPIDAVLLLRGGGAQAPPLLDGLPQALPVLRRIAHLLRQDIRSSGQGVLRRGDSLLRIHVLFRQGGGVLLRLEQDRHGQRLQSLLPGDGSPGAPLGAVGTVQVLQGGKGLRLVDLGAQLRAELVLLVDESADLLPPLLQAAQVFQPFLQGPEGLVVHGPVGLLAVPGDEGDGVPLVQQVDDVLHRPGGFVQFLCNAFCDPVHGLLRYGSPVTAGRRSPTAGGRCSTWRPAAYPGS